MTNYTKGRAREYRTMRILEKAGFDCMRTSGSHGMFDVIAVSPNLLRLIQVKAGRNASPAERESIANYPVPVGVSKELWFYVDGSREPIIHHMN